MTLRSFRNGCRTFHRELGYLAVGLTLVYAISGIVVNHAHHWDANYLRSTEIFFITPPGPGATAEVEPLVLEQLDLGEEFKSTWRANETELKVFLEGGGLDVDLVSGEVVRHAFRRRPLLFDLNFMHLNSGKGAWTGIADIYAGILVVLALTGPWLARGRRGLKGRGGIMMALGLLLPSIYGILMSVGQSF